jgi:hypothetical protein
VKGDAHPPDPERFEHDPALGPLLEQANAEYAAGLDEATAFRRLSERLETRAARRGRWQRVARGPVFALAAIALAALAWERSAERAQTVVFGPELARAGARAEASAATPAGQGPPAAGARGGWQSEATDARQATTQDEPAPPRGARAAKTALDSALKPERAPRLGPAQPAKPRASDSLVSAPPAPAAPVAAAVPESEPREDCLAHARQGRAQAAEHCFGERAAGSGLGAEMALYELARLRRDVLRDATGALAALGEYRARFPRGSLRNEVDLSRVELLAELGRGAQALSESAALLDTASGRERAAELHVLRGNIYRRDPNALQAAADEYAQAEARGGARGAEASRLRGDCLEALGDIAGALQAYRRYANVPGQPHAAEVSRQIERLSAGVHEGGSQP